MITIKDRSRPGFCMAWPVTLFQSTSGLLAYFLVLAWRMPPLCFSEGACINMLRMYVIVCHHTSWNPVYEGGHILRRSYLPKTLTVFAVLFTLLLSACGAFGGNTTTPNGGNTIPSGSIKIGVSLSLTGDNSADGQATKRGYDTWEAYVNSHGGLLGHQVQMVYYDDATKQAQTRANYEKLVSVDKVNFVLGPFGDPQTVTGAEVARQHHMLFLEGSGTGPEVFHNGLDNLFSVSPSATAYFSSFTHYILSLPADMRPATAAYATSDDSFTQPQIDTARAALEKGGIKTALYTVYSAENADPTGPAQKVVGSHADIVLLGTIGLQDCQAYLKTFLQQHYNPKLVVAAAGPDQGQTFIDAIGKNNTEGLIVPNDGWWPEARNYQNPDFVKEITSKYNIQSGDISSDSVQAFSVGQVLQQAIERAKTVDNQKLMNELRTDTFRSLQGPVAFDDVGQNRLAVGYLFQWQKQSLIPVYPQGQAVANVEYPKPSWATS
jgi:branched-chain amino acid transport system substrate-binding protein